MAQLMDMAGNCCGNFEDGVQPPDGYWSRRDDALSRMPSLDFLDLIGAERFAAIWSAAVANSALAFPMVRGLAAQNIEITESFPQLRMMEQLGLLPEGTAVAIWS